jgi:hypothetical protein
MDNIRVGPDQLLHSSPITEWQSYTPTFENLGTISVHTSYWRRVGDHLELNIRFTLGTPAAATAAITLPPGLVIDTSKINQNTLVGHGIVGFSSAGARKRFILITNTTVSTTKLFFANDDYTTASNPFIPINGNTIANVGDPVGLQASVPIASWTGSTVSIDNSQVEYAYNTTPWGDSTDTNSANTAYGPEGAAFAAIGLSSHRRRRVKFLTPIQPTDEIDVQVSRDGGRSFVSVGKGTIFSVNSWAFQKWTYVDGGSTSNTHGIGASIVNANLGEVDVHFGQHFFIATDTTPTVSWASEVNSNYRWRVVKSRNPLTIGGLTGSLWQRKLLTSDFSTIGNTIYQFLNLEIGKTYVFSGSMLLNTNTTGTYIAVDIEHNGTRRDGYYLGQASNLWATYTFRYMFVAEATTIRIYLAEKDGNARVVHKYGSPPAPQNHSAYLEELPLHQQTSKWT